MRQYNTFHDAYVENLKLVYNNPQFYNAPRGFRSREVLNNAFVILNPVERVCYLPSRRTNIVFCFAEVLWYLAGSNSLDFISYYAKSMQKYSADQRTLTGTAYGPKIFSFGPEQINQWDRIVNLLTNDDPETKRAVIQIFDPSESLTRDNIDVSCTIGWQFFVRNGKLYMTTYMRANDAFRGIVSDVFSFTFVQELLARQLGLEVGSYCHMVGSAHVYESDYQWAEKVIAEAEKIQSYMYPFSFPRMPLGDNWRYIHVVLELEQRLRENKFKPSVSDLSNLSLPEYWRQVVILFEVYREIVREKAIKREIYQLLIPVYQYLVANRWSSYVNDVMQYRGRD